MGVLVHEMNNGQETNAAETKVHTLPRLSENDEDGVQIKDEEHLVGNDLVNIVFEDIKYTVSLGYKKGLCCISAYINVSLFLCPIISFDLCQLFIDIHVRTTTQGNIRVFLSYNFYVHTVCPI